MGIPTEESVGADTGDSEDSGGADDFDLPLTDDTGFTSKGDDDAPIIAAKPKPAAKVEASAPDALAELARRRAERSVKLQSERATRELEAKTKDLEAKASRLERFDQLKAGGKKLDAVKEMGFELSDLIDEHMEAMGIASESGAAPTGTDKAMAARLAKLEDDLAASKKDALDRKEAAEREAQEASRNRATNGATEVAKQLLGGEADRYEVINSQDAQAEAFQEFGSWCRKHNVEFANDGSDEAEAREMFKTFADSFEELLASRIEKAARTKKLSARLGRRPAEAQAAGRPATAKTATSRTGRSAPPVETEDDFADVTNPRDRARLLGRRISLTE